MYYSTMLKSLLLVTVACAGARAGTHNKNRYTQPDHPLLARLYSEIDECHNEDMNNNRSCTPAAIDSIVSLCGSIANGYTHILLYDRAQEIFKQVAVYVDSLPNTHSDNQNSSKTLSTSIDKRIAHVRAVLAFSEGDAFGAQKLLSRTIKHAGSEQNVGSSSLHMLTACPSHNDNTRERTEG